MQNQTRLSFQEMIWSESGSGPADDEWAVINDHEQRLRRLEKLLIELLKVKLRGQNKLELGPL